MQASKRPCISTLMQGLCSYGMQHLNFDLLLTARIRPSAKRKERGLWLRAGSVMEQGQCPLMPSRCRLRCTAGGAGGGDRTHSLTFTSRLLYPIELHQHKSRGYRTRTGGLGVKGPCLIQLGQPSIWSSQRGLNPRHPAWRAGALPTEL